MGVHIPARIKGFSDFFPTLYYRHFLIVEMAH
jgi:hypothetical protein